MDVLADVLSATKVGGTVAAAVCADAPWGIDFPQQPLAGFHYICEGSCWLRPYGADPIPLTAGDLVLLSAGAGHVMASDPSGPTLGFHELARNFGGSPAVVVELSGSGPRTRLVCGGYRFDAHSAHPMLRLPPLLWLKAARQRRDLSQTLQMLSTELTTQQPGTLTIVDPDALEECDRESLTQRPSHGVRFAANRRSAAALHGRTGYLACNRT